MKTYKNFTIHEFEELESTNKTAFELASLNKISDKEIILAKKQTGGKGRKDRSWESPEGNLYFSILLKPKITIKKISQISFVAATALKLTLQELLTVNCQPSTVKNKWPNDLLIDEKKCAGILLESKINQQDCEFVVLGIGVNLVSNPENTIFPATNLKNFNIEISAEKILEIFLNNFEKFYQNFLDFGFNNIRKIWLEGAYRLNQEIVVDKKIRGIFRDFDEEGNLILEIENKLEKISVGDVS